jgi:dTDP-4-dehydrorhamnose reductase
MILVTGANGQLGQCFQALAATTPQLQWHFASSRELDIAQNGAADQLLAALKPIWCINCAAYTAVDKAETEPEAARSVNTFGAARLARACARTGTRMIHFSTDYVYHGRNNHPLTETDPVRPRGVYARTKLAGEKAVAKALPGAMIIRTAWVYSEFGHNFVKTMLRLSAERPELRVVFDQIGSLTYGPNLARAVLNIVQQVEQKPETSIAGIWHYSNEGVCSWFDVAHAVVEMAGRNCQVLPIETRDFPTPAQRPPFSLLNKGKIKTAFALQIPHWRDSLQQCLHLLL